VGLGTFDADVVAAAAREGPGVLSRISITFVLLGSEGERSTSMTCRCGDVVDSTSITLEETESCVIGDTEALELVAVVVVAVVVGVDVLVAAALLESLGTIK